MTGHLFWIGLLIGLLVAVTAPGWITALLVAVSLGALGGFHLVSEHHASGAIVPWLLVAALGLGVGLYFGRIRGLRHLGQAEFRARLTTVKNISRF